MLFQQKFPRRFVPAELNRAGGDIQLVCHPNTRVDGYYTISPDDGRLCVTGWKDFMKKENNLKMGDKMLFMLYIGIEGVFMFASHVPELPRE